MNAARTALLVAACAALGAGPARAVKLPGLGPAADREALRALRGAELEDATRGGWQPTPEFREALGRLPEKCRGEVPGAPDCDDELRCAWLGARAAALLAWSGGGAGERAAAAARLHRLANRIAAGGACGRGEERARWERDRAAAEVDDATAHLALLRELPDIAGAPLVGAADQAPLAALRRARGPAPPEALRALRRALHEAVQHETWLAAQPVLARLRAGLQQAWAEYGGVPGDCGAELLRVDLLEDQWRGYLVREVVPQALECLALRNTRERARRGAPADPALAQRLARDLAASARADEGGRSFGASRAALAGLDELLAAVSSAPAGTALARAAPPPARARREPVPAAARRPAAPPLAAAPSAPAPAPAPAPRAADLARIAARVAEYSGDVDATARAAGAARGERERALVQRELFIALHRAVCAPVFEVDPEDVEAARHALGAAFPRQPETACRGGEDVAGLEALLRAAPDLRRLAAGGALRSAARLAALGRGGEARRLIDAVPEDLRGLTWALVSAWTARLERDPVRAARDLSRVDRDTLDRLRTSAADDVARLVSRASAVAP